MDTSNLPPGVPHDPGSYRQGADYAKWIRESELRREASAGGPTPAPSADGAARDREFIGGLKRRIRWGVSGATWPLVRLRLAESGLIIEPTIRAFRLVIPQWSFPWSCVRRAEQVGDGGYFVSGVRFFVHGQEQPFVFWHSHPEQVLRALEARRVEVDYTRHWIKRWGT
jgi:hypothetical protein